MNSYIVEKGDTLERLAWRAGYPSGVLTAANPWLVRQPYLIPGQIISLPDPPPVPRYQLQQGDTVDQIAIQFQRTAEALVAANPSLEPGPCQPGVEIVIPRVTEEAVVHLRGEYGYDTLMDDLASLKNRYDRLETGMIGHSVLGKPIPYVRIGHGPFQLHVNAAVHANEWLTTPVLLRFVEDLAEAVEHGGPLHGTDPTRWLEQTTLWVVPMVNPDGVELVLEGAGPSHPWYGKLMEWNGGLPDFRSWKANIRGVDLNDQFPAYWEEEARRRLQKGPGRRDYGGESPLSEPESRALADWTIERNFDAVLSLHSQGEEIYWNYRDFEPKESLQWAIRLGAASGYRPVKLSGSDAGYKDWFIYHFRKPGFTIEVGSGRNPLPLSDYPAIRREVACLLGAAMSELTIKK
ncbi:M14 family zinc carboxypeptidase [Paenibacillus sp. JX-17]|uniref:M14 family zinc carboxypeptidase n=1 Tax=Paenibacillus lacisoli TaxID=3064525 RepID=A0ABT9CEL0_9BACL|nr:M14 family metallopeptidase [Paenibacillus sp. JX-17]MDO7906043.1 M14 family zinc carboxypeptidase [Paenibacillus sp. JX-17]